LHSESRNGGTAPEGRLLSGSGIRDPSLWFSDLSVDFALVFQTPNRNCLIFKNWNQTIYQHSFRGKLLITNGFRAVSVFAQKLRRDEKNIFKKMAKIPRGELQTRRGVFKCRDDIDIVGCW
jgi:hypothetical protein